MITFLQLFLLFLKIILIVAHAYAQVDQVDGIEGSSVNEFRGYFIREHSLIKPYQGASADVPYWNIVGSAIVSTNQIRLTADIQSLKGGVWNKLPCHSRDWEVQLHFRVSGATGSLFGDGMAFWYVQEPNMVGDVFGSKDYFRGLGIFLDTYSNHNGAHSHSHPYISAMVSNGSLHYDHDSDGTHTALGNEHTGCEAKFRNKEYDTQILIRYVGDILSVYTDVLGAGVWKRCFSVGGVRLPTNYFFGVTAMTGELSDNHDVISFRTYKQEYARVERSGEPFVPIEPHADSVAAPRDHVDTPRPSRLGWIGTTLLVIVGLAVVVVVLGFGLAVFQKRQERWRKRFY